LVPSAHLQLLISRVQPKLGADRRSGVGRHPFDVCVTAVDRRLTDSGRIAHGPVEPLKSGDHLALAVGRGFDPVLGRVDLQNTRGEKHHQDAHDGERDHDLDHGESRVGWSSHSPPISVHGVDHVIVQVKVTLELPLESVAVTVTVYELAEPTVPLILPVLELIESPVGNPVAE